MVLNVGGSIYTTQRLTLVKDRSSMLAALFSGRYKLPVDQEGRFFIDRDGKYFEYILSFLRDERSLPPSSLAVKVRRQCEVAFISMICMQLKIPHSMFNAITLLIRMSWQV